MQTRKQMNRVREQTNEIENVVEAIINTASLMGMVTKRWVFKRMGKKGFLPNMSLGQREDIIDRLNIGRKK